MDPAIVLFGLGIGVLVGMTGMGGGSLMTPLLILIFGIHADDGDRHRHLLLGDHEDGRRLAPPADGHGEHGAGQVALLRQRPGRDRRGGAGLRAGAARLRRPARTRCVYAVLGGTLLMVGVVTLSRALILRRPDRRARALRGRDTPQGRRGRDRRHHRLRDRDHLGRLGHGDRDPADRRLPAGAEEGRRHRHRPCRDPALGRRRSPTSSPAISTSASPPTSSSARSPG